VAGDTSLHLVATYDAAAGDSAQLISAADGGIHTLSDGSHVGVMFQGGAGDQNTILIHNTNFASIDGGANGHNSLTFSPDITGTVSLNTSNIHNISDLNVGNSGASVTLTVNDVLNMSPTKILTVEGGSNSSLTLGSGVGTGGASGWTDSGQVTYHGTTYEVYSSHQDPTVQVWAQSGVGSVTVH
jgi:hypothetical protein